MAGMSLKRAGYTACPVCGNKDHCHFSENQKFLICKKVETDYAFDHLTGRSLKFVKPAPSGGSLYVFDDEDDKKGATYRNERTVRPVPFVLPDDERDIRYRAFLGKLELAKGHYQYFFNEWGDVIPDLGNFLVRQGVRTIPPAEWLQYQALRKRNERVVLTPAETNALRYFGEGRRSIAAALSAEYDLRGLPGFYLDTYKGESKWTFNGAQGFLLPTRNIFNQIVAFQTRPDVPPVDGDGKPKGKYFWFSSDGYRFDKDTQKWITRTPEGSSPGARLDFLWPKDADPYVVNITEGWKKKWIVHKLMGQSPTINSPGVECFGDLQMDLGGGLTLLEYIKQRGTKIFNILYDMDRFETKKRTVLDAEKRLIELLQFHGFKVYTGFWDERFKGIDDALLNGIKPESRNA